MTKVVEPGHEYSAFIAFATGGAITFSAISLKLGIYRKSTVFCMQNIYSCPMKTHHLQK